MRLPKNFLLITLCLTCICLANATHSRAQATARISAKNRQAIKVAIHLLDQHHVSQRPLGDELSQRIFESLFESLDPAKLHFLQSDLEEHRHLERQIDDLAKQGDMSPATSIFHRITTRSSESLRMIEKLLEGGLDFSADESVIVDSDKRDYAVDGAELRDRWRRELKWKILVQEAKDSEIAKSGEEVLIAPEQGTPAERVLQEYRRRHRRLTEMNGEKVFEWYLNVIASAYDPHTSYMLPRTSDEFMIHIRSNFQGIGAELREQGDYVYITGILEGGGASRCKEIAAGDRILAVSQDGHNWVSAIQKSSADLADMIRGKAETIVQVRVRSKAGEERVAVIERSRVELKRDQASGRLVRLSSSESTDLGVEEFKVGYIRLPGFYQDGDARRRGNKDYRSCSRDVEKLLIDFRDHQANAVILDLRGNGGGLLDEAIRLVGLFIDKGPVVQVKDGEGTQVFKDPNPGTTWKGPLVVLTNKYSASASEIVAGALQDYGRAVVVGDPQTHGKGTVQTPLNISTHIFGRRRNVPSMGTLKLTIQKYYLPDGLSTQRIGVTPGVVIPFSFSTLADGEAQMTNAIAHDRIPSARHDRYSMNGDELLSQLEKASLSRMSKSEYFKKIESQVSQVTQQRASGKIAIRRDKFETYWDELTDDQESADDAKEKGAEASFPRNEYDNEVLRIVGDYVNALDDLRSLP